jgi:hypothetical protein
MKFDDWLYPIPGTSDSSVFVPRGIIIVDTQVYKEDAKWM